MPAKRLGFWALAAWACAAQVWQPASAQPLLELTAAERRWLAHHPVVRYAIDPYWPMEYLENGEHRGLTREYLDHVARVSGIQFERVDTRDWADTLRQMANGRIDLSPAVSLHLMSASSRQALLVSDPYFVGTTLVISRTDEPILFNPQKLHGKRVMIKGGGGYEQYLREHFPSIQLLTINGADAALAAVAEGRADAAVGLDAALQPVINRQFAGQLHVAGALAQMPVELAMGISREHPELQAIINKSLATLTSQGTDHMVERWIATTDYGVPTWATLVHHYSLQLSTLALILAAFAALARRARLAQIKAQRSEARTSAFLAMMSHEIRTPMNAILASLELLLRGPLAPREQELTALANSSALNLLELLDDVLDVARLDASQLHLSAVPTDVHGLVRSAADIHRLAAQAKGLALDLDSLGLDNQWLLVDPVRVRQLLSNLLSNAVKFTEQGVVGLLVRLQREASGRGGLLRITVSDTGIGITPEQQKHLFQAFAQADSSITRRYGGSGLGLSICKQLVELMEGRIELHSVPAVGTLITVCIPVGLHPAPACAVAELASGLEAGRSAALNLASPAKPMAQGWILVVEDQPVNQQAIDLQLTELGYRSRIVADGWAALQLLEAGEWPALVLLDCYLPGMDGYEVARRLRALQARHGPQMLPVLAISAASDETHRLRSMESGMDGWLSKPLRLAQLSETLRLWLPEPLPPASLPPPQDARPRQRLQQVFIQSSVEDLQALNGALHKAELAAALHSTHRLHGAALTMGVSEMAGVAAELENLLHQQQIPVDWQQRLEQLERALQRYRQLASL